MPNQKLKMALTLGKMALVIFSLNQAAFSAPDLTCENCDALAMKTIEDFKMGRPLKVTQQTQVFHGKCEFYRNQQPTKIQMGLVLIENIGGNLHYATSFQKFVNQMDQGWNPYRYTSIETMQRTSGGFHREAEQELFTENNYSYNKLRVNQADSFHHIYINQNLNGDETINIIGKKGDQHYLCQMRPNSELPQTPSEDGVPVSFGKYFCDLNFNCNNNALETIKDYHHVTTKPLEPLIEKPLHGACRLNTGRSSVGSFDQVVYSALRFEKEGDSIFLNSSFTQGPKTNPFEPYTTEELTEKLDKNRGHGAQVLPLETFSIALSQGHRTWIRKTQTNLYLLGTWMGKNFTCDIEL